MTTVTPNPQHTTGHSPWNKGHLIGPKPPLKLPEVWGIRIRLQLESNTRQLALFNLAIDSKLRGCDLMSLQVRDVVHGGRAVKRAAVIQEKTGRPAQFELTPQTRQAVAAWVSEARICWPTRPSISVPHTERCVLPASLRSEVRASYTAQSGRRDACSHGEPDIRQSSNAQAGCPRRVVASAPSCGCPGPVLGPQLVSREHRGFLMSNAFNYKRLDRNDAALLLVDHQSGLISLVQDFSPGEFKNNVLATAACGDYFGLPTILTTSFEDGPNGPLVPELKETFPNAPYIARPGNINAWDNEDFVNAVKATGKRQLIIAGVVTEVCVAFPALSALEEGYDVYVVTDASGTFNQVTRDAAWYRMQQAGVQLMSWFAMACELHRDWRNDIEELGQLFSDHIPNYRNLMTSYFAKG